LQQEKEDYIIDLSKPLTIDKVIEKDNSFKITNIRNVSTYVPIVPVKVKKISRNEPCKCGSGMKFKRCCGK
jgi:uncharacterized protein YchJ